MLTRHLFAEEIKHEAEEGLISGYASTYGLDLVGDRIAPGAFAQSIKDKRGKIPILMNHWVDNLVGLTTSLSEDHKGLAFDGKLFTETDQGRNAYLLLKALKKESFKMGMSIGFRVHNWDMDEGVRILQEIELFEASITPFPAQPKASVTDVKDVRTVRDLEQFLREVGCSKADAERLVALTRKPPEAALRDAAAQLLRTTLLDEALSHHFPGAK